MDGPAPAEQLPERYRAILDRVAELEGRGLRRDAARIRSEATRAYSRAWDARALRALDALLGELERLANAGRPAPPRTGLTRHARGSAPSR